MTASVDDFAELLRPSASREVGQILHLLGPDELTPCEILGILAILRPAMDRYNAANATPADVVRLVR